MKSLIFIAIMSVMSLGVEASENKCNVELKPCIFNTIKAIDITIVCNGYTIHIVGTATFNALTGQLTYNVTVTITGNGCNISFPLSYNGSIAAKGTHANEYDERKIIEEDKPVVQSIMSQLYLPVDDPKSVRVDQIENTKN